jgi:hypothetical protein
VGFDANEFDSEAQEASDHQNKPREDDVTASGVEVRPRNPYYKWNDKDTQGAKLKRAVNVHVDGICCL